MSTSFETIISSQLVIQTVVQPATSLGDGPSLTRTDVDMSISTTVTASLATPTGTSVSFGGPTATVRLSSATSPSVSGSRPQSLSIGAAVGIGVGATLAAVLILMIAGWAFRWRRRKRKKTTTTTNTSAVGDLFADGVVSPVMEKDGQEKFEAGTSSQVAEAPNERDHIEAGGRELVELEAIVKAGVGGGEEKK